MTALILFLLAFIILFLGYPIWFSFAAVALAVGSFAADVNFAQLPYMFETTVMGNSTLMAIPLFIFMGVVLQRTGLAEKLLESMGKLFGPVPGGLAISTVIVGAFLAAATGVVGATVVAMGVISLPVMLKYNYNPRLATGVICAAGTLGQIIPPSIILIILSEVTYVDLGVIFGAALQPGLMLVGAYLIYILLTTNLVKNSAPRLPATSDSTIRLLTACIINILPTLMLIGLVLGSILRGWATATESSAVGAIGSLFLAFFFSFVFGLFSLKGEKVLLDKVADILSLLAVAIFLFAMFVVTDFVIKIMEELRIGDERSFMTNDLFATLGMSFRVSMSNFLSLFLVLLAPAIILGFIAMYRYGYVFTPMKAILSGFKGVNPKIIFGAGSETVKVSSMVYAVIIGAIAFSTVFNYAGGTELFQGFFEGLPGGHWTFIIISMLMIFLLGFFIDFVEIAYIIVPILLPVAQYVFDLNITWFAILIAMNLQSSFMTPPFGFSLFYLKGVAPEGVKTTTIYRGVIPFIIIQAIIVLLLVIFPTWFGFDSIFASNTSY